MTHLDGSSHPCQLYKSHHPIVARTQRHHRYPQFLQERLWGKGVVRLKELLIVCGTDHDSIHAWINWLLGEERKPSPEPGTLAKREAQRAFDWYKAESPAAAGDGS